MRRAPLLVAALLLCLLGVAAPSAHAAATVSLSGDTLFVGDSDPDGNRLKVRVEAGDYVVDEEEFGEPGITAGTGCTGGYTAGDTPAPVTCPRTAPTATGTKVNATLGDGNGINVQHIELGAGVGDGVLTGGDGVDELIGGAGNDVLRGGAGNDHLLGGAGADQLYGEQGEDDLEGGEDPDQLIGGAGGDLLVDLGSSGGDIASYNAVLDTSRTTGVDVTLDMVKNDGSAIDDGTLDNVADGIESIAGTDFDDVLEGDGQANALTGWAGADTLIGGGGADSLTGHAGQDTLDAEDGHADSRIHCNNSDASAGTNPNTAFIDSGLDDPVVTDCSNVVRSGAGGGGGGGGGTTTTGGGGTQNPIVPPAAGQTAPAFFGLAATAGTANIARMPNVVGVKAASARERVLKAIPSADIDIDFQRGCRDSQDNEIIKQSPLRGAAVANDQRDAAAISLTMCLADRDFLRDCDLKDLRSDVRKLRGKTDAEFTQAILDGVARCKVDFDVRIAKAAKEAEIALAAQKLSKRSKKGQIRAAIDCPSAPEQNDLRVYAKEDYVLGRKNTSFGLKASGPDGWTLPAGFRSFVTLEGIDRAFQFLGNPTTYVDADDVTSKGNTMRRQEITWSKGRARFNLTPEHAGTIRICTILESGGDEVLSHALSIRVVPRPKNGTRWETVGGRVIEVSADGGEWLTEAQASGTAHAAFLDKVWGFVVSLFDGRSRTVNAEQTASRPNRQKVEEVYTQGKLGMAQLTLDGTLVGDPQPPVVRDGPCFYTAPDGKLSLGTCKQLQPAADRAALFGTSFGASPIVAAGAGNIVAAGGGNIVAAGAGNLVGPDGATLVGPDGASLIGPDGASLVGPDGASLVGPDGASIVAAGAGNIVAAGAGNIVAAGGGNAISVAPAQIVAAGGGNIVAAGAGNIVAAGGLN